MFVQTANILRLHALARAARPSAVQVSGGRAEKALSRAAAPVKRPPSLCFFLGFFVVIARATPALASR